MISSFDPGSMTRPQDLGLGAQDISAQLRRYEEKLKHKDQRIADLLTVIRILSKELRNG